MSRGLGRWQRLLLHELYHNPRREPEFLSKDAAPWINTTSRLTTSARQTKRGVPNEKAWESEDSAIRRAARSLVAKGWARPNPLNGQAYTLYQVTPAPDITCPQCGRKCSELRNAVNNSEHLNPGGEVA
jgi:hypothetical protein